MSVGTIILAVLVFGMVIFVHELGHFIAARWARIRVLEFALGMGPIIFSVTRGETRYALRLFPIGGFCAMEGENDESADAKAYCNAPLYKRAVVSAAGSAMNLLLGLILLGILSARMPLLGTTQIARFEADAVSSGQLQAGDTILKVNGHRVRTNNDLVYEFMRERYGVMEMTVKRQGVDGTLTLDVPFRMDEAADDPSIRFIYMDFTVYGVKPTFWGVVRHTFNWTGSVIRQVWGSLADLVTGRFGFNQLSGPVGVTEAIGKASSEGGRSLMMLVSFITVNLGVFNMLPLPALDGGRLLFMLVELIRRKPLNPKHEGYVHAAGFIMLIALMIAVTFSDIMKLFTRLVG